MSDCIPRTVGKHADARASCQTSSVIFGRKTPLGGEFCRSIPDVSSCQSVGTRATDTLDREIAC